MGSERAGHIKAAGSALIAAFVLWGGATVLVGSPTRYVSAGYAIDNTTTTSTGSTTTSSTTTTTTTGNPPGSNNPPGSTGNSGGGGFGLVFTGPPPNPPSGLAFTGANVELTMAVGAGAVGVGGMLVLASKRRRPTAKP